MTIYARTGATISVTLQGRETAPLPSGLVGSLAIRITHPLGETVLPRTTIGITETPAASGTYVWTGAAPVAFGPYDIYWDEPTQHLVAQDDLVVNATGYAAGELCTLEDVRIALNLVASDTSQDEEIQALISSASDAIQAFAEREFAPATDNVTRRFSYYDTGGLIDLAPYDLRAAASVTVNPDASTPTIITATDYTLAPVLSRDGVFNQIFLHRTTGAFSWPSGSRWHTVEVVGDWGFPAVPPSVNRAAVVTVSAWANRSSADFADVAEGVLDTEPARGSTFALPLAARLLLQPYRRMAFA